LSSPVPRIRCAELAQLWLNPIMSIVGEIGTQSFPNEGLRRSVRNASISGLAFGLGGGLVVGLGVGLLGGPDDMSGLDFGLGVGLLGVMGGGLRFGGRAYLQHCALRLVLWYNHCAPFNYIRFLDYATARIFLRKVGGGYVFIHRMLLEYFAAMHQTSAEPQNCNRNG
jgi:eukaryotic-like serine/threonine-protein kinase